MKSRWRVGGVRKAAAAIAVLLVYVLGGCSDSGPGTGPTTSDFERERAAVGAKHKKGKKGKKGHKVAKKSSKAKKRGKSSESGTGYAAVDDTYVYDSTGKRDPFRSIRYAEIASKDSANSGPLADYELGQLQLAAVVWEEQNPHALVRDPSGRSFIVHEGSQIGRNRGRVIHIGDNLVLVKETYVNFAGEQTTKDVELRIRSRQGG